MLLLPVARTLGVLVIAEVVLVLRLGQPSPHELAFPGLAALGLKTVTLPMSSTTIGKKKFLAVQALASGFGRLHRFHRQQEPIREAGARRRKKTQSEEDSVRRRRKKRLQRILRRKCQRIRSNSRPVILIHFYFTAGTHGTRINRASREGSKRCKMRKLQLVALLAHG